MVGQDPLTERACTLTSLKPGNLYDILKEFPFRIRYEDERAVDTGGVCRDMFSAFWEEAHRKHFDGEKLLVLPMQRCPHSVS